MPKGRRYQTYTFNKKCFYDLWKSQNILVTKFDQFYFMKLKLNKKEDCINGQI
jgi:hypothetical protein